MKHTYFREINLDANDSLATIARSVAAQTTVLDVGTGSGALGRYLKTRNCVVDGITYSEEEAREAVSGYDRLEIVDLEVSLPSAVFSEARYDVVVCADILEHLRNATDVLVDLRRLLAPEGRILLSIPNATYMGVLFGLLSSRFVRTQEGVLDITHVNFFDRLGLEQFVERAGFRISRILDVRKGLLDSEFADLDTLALPSYIRQYVASLPDTDVYQFVWELRPSDLSVVPHEVLTPARPNIPMVPQFDAQVFWDLGDGFDESLSVHARGDLNENPQMLKFNFELAKPPVRLRLDMVDRPGIFEFFCFRLMNGDGQELLSWNGDWSPELQLNGCEILPDVGEHGGRVIRAIGDDPWISLPGHPAWQSATQAELVITAPQPYRDAAFHWAERRYSSQIADLETRLQQLRLEIEQKSRQHLEVLHALTHDRDTLSHRIADMESSTSWRITGGLRRLSRWLKKG